MENISLGSTLFFNAWDWEIFFFFGLVEENEMKKESFV